MTDVTATMSNQRLLKPHAAATGPFSTGAGASGVVIEAVHEVGILPPVAVHPAGLAVDDRYRAGPTFVMLLPGGYVDPATGYLFTRERVFVRESAVVQKYLDDAARRYPGYDFDAAIDAGPGIVGVLSGQRSANYSHWWLDILSKPFLFETRPVEAVGGRPVSTWLVNDPASPQQRESLDLLGLIPTATPEGGLVRGDLLVSTGLTFNGAQALSPLVAAYGAHVLDKVGLGGASTPRRGRKLYISRSNAKMRRVVDEAELAAELTLRGFEILSLENLSARVQMETFAQADVIVAPHGAGLTNILFSRPGTLLIELFPLGGVHSSSFRRLATHLGMTYGLYAGPAVAPDRPGASPNNLNFEVDTHRLLGFIDRVSRAHAPSPSRQ